MGSRDRPSKEAKKKPKDAGNKAKVQPLYEPPQQVDVVRKPRKPRSDDGNGSDEG